MSTWGAGTPGILSLPSGRLVRGRGLRRPLPDDTLPEFAIYLLNKRPKPVSWESRWIRWPDFGLPTDRHDAQNALREAWRRAAEERVLRRGSRPDRHGIGLLGGAGRLAC